MFDFFRRPVSRPLSEAISQAIQKDGSTPVPADLSQLRMVQSNGRYSDRKVTFFRIFAPAVAEKQSLDIRRYQDLDHDQDLIVRSGHIESDGVVILTRPVVVRAAPQGVRTRAGRIVPNMDEPLADAPSDSTASLTSTDASAAGPIS